MQITSRISALTRDASVVAILGASMIFAYPGNANAADYTMAIAHILPEDMMTNEVHPSLTHFKSLVEAETGGAVEVQIFGGGQLGSEVETAQQAQDGVLLQATVISSGAMSSFYPKYQAITAPFLFPNYRVARAYFDGPYHAEFMAGTVEEAGLRFLGTFDDGGGFVAFTNSVRPIRTVEDIQGLRIRVEENPAHVAIMRALGASATPLPWGEVVTALGTGLADGQFNAPGVSKSFSLWEVNSYTTMSGHIYNSQSWMVSEDWFQSLPEEHQDVIVRAAREAVHIGHGIAALQAIDGWNVSCQRFDECYVLPAEERRKMAEIARPAWRTWITDDFGLEESMVNDLLNEVARIEEETGQQDIERYAR
jgi:tripartite ATP-independent transporter DctP family solute receptor